MSKRSPEQDAAKKARARGKVVREVGLLVRAAARVEGFPLAELPALALHLSRPESDLTECVEDLIAIDVLRDDAGILRATQGGRNRFAAVIAEGGRIPLPTGGQNLGSRGAESGPKGGAETSAPGILSRQELGQLAALKSTNPAAYDAIRELVASKNYDGARAALAIAASLVHSREDSPKGSRPGLLFGTTPAPGPSRKNRVRGPCALDQRELVGLVRDVLSDVDGLSDTKAMHATLTLPANLPDLEQCLIAATEDLVRRIEADGGRAVFVLDISEKGQPHMHGLVAARNCEDIRDDWAATTGGGAYIKPLTGWARFVLDPTKRSSLLRQGAQWTSYCFEDKPARVAFAGPIELGTDVIGTQEWTALLNAKLGVDAAAQVAQDSRCAS